MNTKKLALLAIFIFAGLLVILKVASLQQEGAPFYSQISKNAFIVGERTPVSFLGFKIPDLSAILNSKPQVDTYLQNTCINNKDPKTLSTKEQLLEFIQGPCQPVILIPGLLASKLTVKIDCETLQKQNPSIFKACGWETCSTWSLKQKPLPEYTVWISDITGPLSLVLESTAKCWGEIMQLDYDEHANDLKGKYKSPAGVDIVVYEQKDPKQQNCAFAAESNLIEGSPLQTGSSKGYLDMKEALVSMGYQVGLTLYGAPYDWRKTTVANGIGIALNDTLKQIYGLTGKQTIIVGHSLGNFGALYLLNSLTQADKDKYIANYVSLMNPLSGSPKSVLAYVGGDSEYFYQEKYGMSFSAQKKLFQGSSGAIDVLPKDPFNYFAGEEWLNEWRTRINLEKKHNVTTSSGLGAWKDLTKNGNYPYKWFPSPLQQCFKGYLNRPNECALFMYDWSEEHIVQVKDTYYTASENGMTRLFKDHVTVTDRSHHLFSDAKSNDIYQLKNPGVPTTIVYGSHIPTMKSFYFDYDPKDNTNALKYAKPTKITYTPGDKTVPTSSSLLPAFKWSWEFDNKEKAGLPHAKPVKTIETCSIYNNKGTIYDKKNTNAPYEVLQNEYIGVECDCKPVLDGFAETGAECAHSPILGDKGLIKLIKNIANANARNSNYKETKAYLLSDAQLKDLSGKCPTVTNGAKGYFELMKNMMSITV